MEWVRRITKWETSSLNVNFKSEEEAEAAIESDPLTFDRQRSEEDDRKEDGEANRVVFEKRYAVQDLHSGHGGCNVLN